MVSVIVPCFNQARFLPDAIRSIQAQTHPDWECIVVNDGSTDATERVATAFAAADGRVRVINQANRGLANARNRGLAEASGRFVQFLDADDILQATKLELQLRVLAQTSVLRLAYCDYSIAPEHDLKEELCEYYMDSELKTTDHFVEMAQRWETRLSIPCHSFLFDARFFTEHGIRFDESLPNHEDWDCWMRIFALMPAVYYLPDKLVVYRLHSVSMCRNLYKMRRGFLKAIDKQRVRFATDERIRTILEEKKREIRQVYREYSRLAVWMNAASRYWRPARVFLGRVARAVLPAVFISRLREPRGRRPSND